MCEQRHVTSVAPASAGAWAIFWNTTPDRNGRHWSKRRVVAIVVVESVYKYGTVEHLLYGVVVRAHELCVAAHDFNFLCYAEDDDLNEPAFLQELEERAIQRINEHIADEEVPE